jgi:HNH endonuclease/AP2 domain
MLTQARLKELLRYDTNTGIFTWLVSPSTTVHAGSIAGCQGSRGNIRIRIDCIEYSGHRLAFLYMTGEWPIDQVDHKDRNPANNAWLNLRQATNAQNNQNKGRTRGVHFDESRGKYHAQIGVNGRVINLGRFPTEEEARQVYLAAKAKYHPFF